MSPDADPWRGPRAARPTEPFPTGSKGAGTTSAAAPIRIALADDAVLLREALAASLAASGFEVVGQAADAPGLLAIVDRNDPDVVIVDVRMPPTHSTEGLEAARELRRRHPGLAILVL